MIIKKRKIKIPTLGSFRILLKSSTLNNEIEKFVIGFFSFSDSGRKMRANRNAKTENDWQTQR